MKNIYDMSFTKLNDYLVENGIAKFRTKQIWNWLYVTQVESFELMKNLDKKTLDLLNEKFYFPDLKVIVKSDLNSRTQKILIELEDGNVIETVSMTHSYGNSVCVTTQVGCKIGCSFCASHLGGFIRNLTAGEIVMQVMLVNKILRDIDERVSHIVIMGIGEPLDNLENVFDFIDTINDEKGLKIGARHITLSTSGIANKIYQVADYPKQINLAISLHAADDKTRSSLMKINNTFSIEDIMFEVDKYIAKTNRRVSIEYIMLKGLNDSKKDAENLIEILKYKNVHVNLIAYNSVEEYDYQPTPAGKIRDFEAILLESNIQVTVRNSKGNSIDGACGQLRRQITNARD